MQFTLGQAKRRLAESSGAYGQNDLRDLVNNAIQALASMSGWEYLRKVLRFSSAGPGFVLPQGCAGLVRACVNGHPTTVRGQDFRFVQSGPGDLSRPPRGFAPVKADNIYDLGMKPVMREPEAPFRLFAMADGASGQGAMVVRGLSSDGRERRVQLTPFLNSEYEDVSTIPATQIASCPVLQTVFEVTVPNTASDYFYLWAEDATSSRRYMIGQYNPEVKAPEFHHYELAGILPGQPVELLVETRIDPIPLVNDSDVVPLPCLEPIEWMIRADWQMKAGEVTAARNYQDTAAKWLKAQEVTNDTVQTSIVINSIFAGSPGEISMESVNI